MGENLKQKYEERDLIRALAKINGFIDEKSEKLSDKLKDTELSHKRRIKLLEKIEHNLKILLKTEPTISKFGIELLMDLLFKINNELTFIGRVKGIF